MSELWVIVPAYNEEHGISATLDALAAQRDPKFTLVVVDNNSTDGTVGVIEAFAAAHPEMRVEIITETQKGTGAASDTGMRYAIAGGATRLARTDADCLPYPEWIERINAGFDSGLRLVSGQLIPRTDEGVRWRDRTIIRIVLEVASAFGKLRPGNQDPRYLGPYVMTPGCNMAITSELYEAAGGFPRTAIEDLHEDRALVNAVRMLTTDYGLRRDVRVHASNRRVRAWGVRKTLAWYADHRYKPELVDIR
ncbi:glycosyltransferase family 2 protein [Nocardia sp. NPDC056100]|uniref:glycosyltransferase family 2 protein n=1 Tax=Nocardia sp. NPDC056100 TaxID=3345712 RepID=UPI0035E326FB